MRVELKSQSDEMMEHGKHIVTRVTVVERSSHFFGFFKNDNSNSKQIY
jgi:hypothetical protein